LNVWKPDIACCNNPAAVDRLALVGTRDDLLPRIAAMEAAGIDEIVIQPVVDPLTEMAEIAKLTA
jgi:hypothetical protein